MITNKPLEYSNLRTIKDVRKARMRLKIELFYMERKLEDDYDGLRDMITLDYWLDKLVSRVPNIIPVIQSVYSGYTFISSLFRGRKC